ncbi:nuclear transport factor 2 family protein [Pelomonas sp. Root1217]|uniref:YybH family protein n=1 Tax=Pelomonas sp. Root1217 TaxID=1736430 RepID=UPI00070CDEBB|nr:nuclear transport factor 2 family protein [Pelomonas sp. Root1217]
MSASQPNQDESAIRGLVEVLVRAIRTKDADLAMSVFAPEVESFDLGPGLRHGGGKPFHDRWCKLFEAYRGEIDYDVHDWVVWVGSDIAFSHSLNRTGGTSPAGEMMQRWVRWTACYRRVDGRWRIVHEHVSVPADLKSGRAMLDQQPPQGTRAA